MLAIQVIANMLHILISKPPLPPKLSVHLPHFPEVINYKQNLHVSRNAQQPAPPPRVVAKTKPHPHTKLKQNANKTVMVRPYTRSFIIRLLHIYNKQTGKKETLRSLLNNQLTHSTWTKATSNEYGRLIKGKNNDVLRTNTMEPVALTKIQRTKAITYGTMVCDHRPLKTKPNRCRLVVRGDKLTCHTSGMVC